MLCLVRSVCLVGAATTVSASGWIRRRPPGCLDSFCLAHKQQGHVEHHLINQSAVVRAVADLAPDQPGLELSFYPS